MFRKELLFRRLQKIRQQEEASLALLERQETELVAALQETEQMIADRLEVETKLETRLAAKISGLERKIELLSERRQKVKELGRVRVITT